MRTVSPACGLTTLKKPSKKPRNDVNSRGLVGTVFADWIPLWGQNSFRISSPLSPVLCLSHEQLCFNMETLSAFPPTCSLMRGSDVCISLAVIPESIVVSCSHLQCEWKGGWKASSGLKLFDGELWKWLMVSRAFISAPILRLLTDWYLYWQQFVYNWNLYRNVDLSHIFPICHCCCLNMISFRVLCVLGALSVFI